jgi:hypothetical protein
LFWEESFEAVCSQFFSFVISVAPLAEDWYPVILHLLTPTRYQYSVEVVFASQTLRFSEWYGWTDENRDAPASIVPSEGSTYTAVLQMDETNRRLEMAINGSFVTYQMARNDVGFPQLNRSLLAFLGTHALDAAWDSVLFSIIIIIIIIDVILIRF